MTMSDDEIALWLITKGTMEDKQILSLAADRILTLRAERDHLREALNGDDQGHDDKRDREHDDD
jgi:hypothetical protein